MTAHGPSYNTTQDLGPSLAHDEATKHAPPYMEIDRDRCRPLEPNSLAPDMDVPISLLRNGIESAEEELAIVKAEMIKLQELYDRNLNKLLERQRRATIRSTSCEKAMEVLKGTDLRVGYEN